MARKEWTKKETDYLYANVNNKNIQEMADDLNRTKSSVQSKMRKMNLQRPSDSWTEEELQYAIDNQLEKSYSEIGKYLGRTKNAVVVKLNRMGYHLSQKYNFNRRFFKYIDNEKKAYWLGFLYADGYISGEYETGIELQRSDKKHLKKFNKDLNGNMMIKDFEKYLDVTQKYYKMSSIRIYSKLFVNDLINHGVMYNKSLEIKMPSLSKEMIRHFVRGFFDGDGSLYLHKEKNHLRAKFTCASIDFINELDKILKSLNIRTFLIDKTTNNRSYNLGISGKKSTRIFLKWIYDNCNIYLDRKYNFYCNNKHLLEYKTEYMKNKYDNK